jgi:hypothetical protein
MTDFANRVRRLQRLAKRQHLVLSTVRRPPRGDAVHISFQIIDPAYVIFGGDGGVTLDEAEEWLTGEMPGARYGPC